mmetsp:Transcript_15152/g.28732  ORF Transcript_15152/g.28732 Transcript_15152/m.28732 type:complete len:321 (-) Transcript_15152:900-1862(-)
MDCGTSAAAYRVIQSLGIGVDIVSTLEGILVKLKVEPAQNHCQSYRSLKCGKLVTHTLASTPSEWQECKIGSNLVRIELTFPFLRIETCPIGNFGIGVRASKAFRIELVWVRPESLIAMKIVNGNKDIHSTNDGRLATPTRRKFVFRPASANQQRWLRVHAQRLGNNQSQVFHLLDIFVIGNPVTNHFVNLLLNLFHAFGVSCQLKERPRENRGRGFVTCNQHGHEIISELLVVDICSSHVDQKSKHGRVFDFVIVAILEFFNVFNDTGSLGSVDEVIENIVKELEVRVEFAKARYQLIGQRQIPVGRRCHTAMFGFDKC